MRKVVLCLAVLTVDASVTQSLAQTSWNHNGSSVTLQADGARRRFVYENPRAGMREVGVGPGTLLFEGVRNGGQYSGKAYVFSKRCGALPYSVSGMVSSDQRQVVLQGTAPQVDAKCRVVGGRSDVLAFDLVEPSIPVVAQGTDFSGQATTAEQDARREAMAFYQGQLDAKTREMNAALRQEQSTRRNIEEQLRIAQQDAAAAEQRARIAEARANSPPEITGSIFRYNVEKPEAIDKFGATAPALLVMLVSFMIEIFKLLTKKDVSLGREMVVGTVTTFASGLALAMLGYSNELKVLSVPLVGGLISVGIMLSIKHLSGHHDADSSPA